MRKAALISCAFYLCASYAYAASKPSVDPALCSALIRHEPQADVAYQPGIDVHGLPVALADLPGQPKMELPEVIKIPLTLDLAKALGLNTSVPPFDKLGSGTGIELGEFTLDGSKVLFNGKPVSDEQQDKLVTQCKRQK